LVNVIKKHNIDLCLEVESGGFDISWSPPMHYHKHARFAYWGSDTHLANIQHVYAQKKNYYHYKFFAQREFVLKHGDAIWLPHACDPEYHDPEFNGKKIHDLTFVGHRHPSVHKARINLLAQLGKQFNVNVRGGLFLDNMAREFKQSKIVFNRSLNKDVNMRFFEAMCSGSCLLTDWISDMEDLGAKRGVHFIAYDDDNVAARAVKVLLGDPERRSRVAKAGQEFVKANHTYDHRAKVLMEHVNKDFAVRH
jgi:hypothetical protein